MSRTGRAAALVQAAVILLLGPTVAAAHFGPPFPIVTDRTVGAYRLAIWTNPDATDDRTPGGKFWVIVQASASGAEPDAATRVSVAVRPLDRSGGEQRAAAAPQPGTPSSYLASLVLDHEGRWQVEVFLDGPLGSASTSAEVDATYTLRPPLAAVPFMLLPFVLVGLFWLKILRSGPRRRLPKSA